MSAGNAKDAADSQSHACPPGLGIRPHLDCTEFGGRGATALVKVVLVQTGVIWGGGRSNLALQD
jgi:hypothetical protein